MNKHFLVLILVFCINHNPVSAQEKEKFLTLNGYVSTMQSVMFDSLSGPFLNEFLIHNRLNFKGYVNKNITFAAEFRNRLFIGDLVTADHTYSTIIGTDYGMADLSWNVLDEQSYFLNTTIDRLWVDLNYGKVQARIGRQRINWGQTLVWNPNDIFNVYSYFDVDYPERPGSDAIRIQYYPGYSSTVEVALSTDYLDKVTGAALYRFNKWGYDIQFLAGIFNSDDLVAGAGWSGSFGSVSFRGEASWFHSAKNYADSASTAIATIGFDKAFRNNSIIQAQVMYCNNPVELSGFGALYIGNLSTKQIAFSEFSAFGSYSYPVSPLLNISLSAMWFPDMNGYYAGPSFDFSFAENAGLSLIWQHFENRVNGIRTGINLGFLRVKFSF
jgi:hypothetical protein